jgi:hypothetical protein
MFKNRKDIAHLGVSLVKSMWRIVAGFHLIRGDFNNAGFWLIAAEVLGIIEELVV